MRGPGFRPVFRVALVAAFVAGVAHAGVGVWTSGGPYDGQVTALAIDPKTPSILYLGTGSGVFKSTDSGRTWANANTGLMDPNVQTLAINPMTPSTLYVGTLGGGAFKSTDSGGTWAAVNTGLPTAELGLRVSAFAINATTPSTLYAAVATLSAWGTYLGFVFKSTDSGATWAAASIGLIGQSFYSLAIDPITPSTLYLGKADGIFKSTDSGLTWAAANTDLIGQTVYSLAIDPSIPSTLYAGTYGSGSGVFKSTDSGGTWAAVNTGLPTNRSYPYIYTSLAINGANPSTLYAATNGAGIFRSTNSGVTWVVESDGLTNPSVQAVAINSSDPSTVYAGTGNGVFKSTDSGGAWAPANTGLTNLKAQVRSLAIDPKTPSTIYTGTGSGDPYRIGNGVFKSTDSGGTWAATNTGLTNLSVLALAIDPTAPSTLYAGTDFGGGVFKSINSGLTWAPTTGLNTQGYTLGVFALAISPSLPTTLYAGTYYGVFRSTDAGATWTATTPGNQSMFEVGALAIDPSTPSTVYVGYGHSGPQEPPHGAIYKSTDSGGTWADVGNLGPITALAIDPKTPSTLYAGAYWGQVLFKSTDSGGTWTDSSTGLSATATTALAIDPRDPSTVYAGTYSDGVFRSMDAGGSWAAINTGLPSTSGSVPRVTALGIDPGSKTVYVGFYGGSVWQLTPSEAVSFPITIPIVLSSTGLHGSVFTSELTLTNRGTSDVSITYTYTSAFGGFGGTAAGTLLAGTQKIVPDAVEYLRTLGIPVGDSGNRGGTLRIDFSGPGSAMVRTTTPVPGGQAGLAYQGLRPFRLLSAPVYLCGLRQNTFDRSNVAVLNAGGALDGPITLRLTVTSGDPAQPQMQALPDITLPPGGFYQVGEILRSFGLSLMNGFVKVEAVAGLAPFYAYAVINDQANSDGSFVEPVPVSPLRFEPGLTLPVLVETSTFSSELVLTNLSEYPRTLHCLYMASALTGGQAAFDISLLPYEQQILPAIVQLLRDRGAIHDPPGGTFVGALFVTDATVYHQYSLGDVSVAARTLTPGDGGRYGVSYSAVPAGSEATTTAWLYGLRQNAVDRTNIALVNVGSTDSTADTFRIDLFDGVTGEKAGTADNVTVPAKGFLQLNAILSQHAPSVSNGYALVTRTGGNNPFITFAVINDGGQPGQRSDDGAFIEAEIPVGP